MAMTEFVLKLTAIPGSRLLMHNQRLADPLDPAARALRDQVNRNKTIKGGASEEDILAVARLEFEGGLYFDKDFGPYIPGPNIRQCLIGGGKVFARGTGAKVQRGVFIKDEVNPLSYRGPRTIDELWEGRYWNRVSAVPRGQGRVIRCRPEFINWSLEADGMLDTAAVELDDFRVIVRNAGTMIGLCDWRPAKGGTCGRFEAEVVIK